MQENNKQEGQAPKEQEQKKRSSTAGYYAAANLIVVGTAVYALVSIIGDSTVDGLRIMAIIGWVQMLMYYFLYRSADKRSEQYLRSMNEAHNTAIDVYASYCGFLDVVKKYIDEKPSHEADDKPDFGVS